MQSTGAVHSLGMRSHSLVAFLCLLACNHDESGPADIAQAVLARAAVPSGALTGPPPPAAPDPARPLFAIATPNQAVGTVRVVMDAAEGRRIPIQLWYPAVESARAEATAGRSVLDFEPPGRERDQWERAARTAGELYSHRTMHAADAPAVAASEQPFPLVLISHCNDCVRFAYFELAERLASKGFVVAAPDHVGNTMYDYWNGTSTGVEIDHFLETRRLDVLTLTDTLLNANAAIVPDGLRGRIDPDRIGAVGHSFGALTMSYASTRDRRIRAVAFLAMLASQGDNLPVLGAELAKRVEPVKLSAPALFLIAKEDGIDLFGLNTLIRQNYEDYLAPTSLVTMRDAGHYSVTNICGIDPLFVNGCGWGLRVTRFPEPFRYLDIDRAMSLTSAVVASYLEAQLNGGTSGALDSVVAGATDVLEVEHRDPS